MNLNPLVTLAVAFPLLSASAQSVHAATPNSRLNGEYAVTATRICAQTQAGFTPQLQALSPVAEQTTILETTDSYDGLGHITIKGRTLTMNNSNTAAGSFPMSESEFTCSGTYSVSTNGNYTQQATCTGTTLSGGSAGQSFVNTTSSGGRVSGKLLLIRDTAPTAETITFSTSGTFTRCPSKGLRHAPRAPGDSRLAAPSLHPHSVHVASGVHAQRSDARLCMRNGGHPDRRGFASFALALAASVRWGQVGRVLRRWVRA
jgi:hypothetical protein